MPDPKLSKEKFIEYVAALVVEGKPSDIIAQACKKTDFGQNIQGKNLFKKVWTEECGYPYVEVNQRIWDGYKHVTVKARLRKYRSWADSIEDYELNGDDLRGIIQVYDLTKYNSVEGGD